MPGRVLNVRPGLIVGAHDYMRPVHLLGEACRAAEATCWHQGGPERRVRVIDARDLAEWIVRMAESAEGWCVQRNAAQKTG